MFFFDDNDSEAKYMALAIFKSVPVKCLNTVNNIASQTAALFTSFPTIIRCWSASAPALLFAVVIGVTNVGERRRLTFELTGPLRRVGIWARIL